MTFDEFLRRTTVPVGRRQQVRPNIKCIDGVSFSVQAGALWWGYPRQDSCNYTHFELSVGRQVNLPRGLSTHRDTGSIFANVPKRLVKELIRIHLGIDEKATFSEYIVCKRKKEKRLDDGRWRDEKGRKRTFAGVASSL